MTSHARKGGSSATALLAVLVVLWAWVAGYRPAWAWRLYWAHSKRQTAYLTVAYAGEEVTTVNLTDLLERVNREGHVTVVSWGLMPQDLATVTGFLGKPLDKVEPLGL